MSSRPFVRSTVFVAAMAAAALACQEDPQSPTPGNDEAAPGGPTAAVTAAVTYSVKDLGTLGGASAGANGINDNGGVVGWSTLANGSSHAFLWRAGKMRDLGALAGGKSEGNDINSNDVVVGWSAVASGAQRAVRWQDGKITNLGSLGGRNSQATAINDFGVIVGWSETTAGNTHAFVWQNGVMQDLGTLGGSYSVALDINNAGKIVGGAGVASQQNHAVTWKNGVIKDLGTNGHDGAVASAVNTKGQIAGTLGPFADAEGEELDFSYPFIYDQGTWISIGGRGPTNELNALNKNGIAVGSAVDLRDDLGREHAWVSQPGVLDALPPLTPGDLNRNEANDINSFGTIVGMSTEIIGNSTGPSHAVLWRRQ